MSCHIETINYCPVKSLSFQSINSCNIYKENMLTLTHQEKEIITISTNNPKECSLLSDKLSELESSLVKPISLLKNQTFPFYDTTNSNNIFNSLSLINLNSIKDFEKKINQKNNVEKR